MRNKVNESFDVFNATSARGVARCTIPLHYIGALIGAPTRTKARRWKGFSRLRQLRESRVHAAADRASRNHGRVNRQCFPEPQIGSCQHCGQVFSRGPAILSISRCVARFNACAWECKVHARRGVNTARPESEAGVGLAYRCAKVTNALCSSREWEEWVQWTSSDAI